ncbi:MAG: ribosome-associated translation inhibitor RaiA [Candidatus Nomurabacteria bacterium]|nr:MAG: ribosome-associated translation inhibitor RaiA [Candidatus Nomurabacteria bacterium]
MNIIIHGQNIDTTDALREYAEDKMQRLEKYAKDITQLSLTFERNFHHRHGKICTVKAQMQVSGPDIYAETEHEDFYAAIDIVQDMLETQLRKRH